MFLLARTNRLERLAAPAITAIAAGALSMATPALAYDEEMRRGTPLRPTEGWSEGRCEATEAKHGRGPGPTVPGICASGL